MALGLLTSEAAGLGVVTAATGWGKGAGVAADWGTVVLADLVGMEVFLTGATFALAVAEGVTGASAEWAGARDGEFGTAASGKEIGAEGAGCAPVTTVTERSGLGDGSSRLWSPHQAPALSAGTKTNASSRGAIERGLTGMGGLVSPHAAWVPRIALAP